MLENNNIKWQRMKFQPSVFWQTANNGKELQRKFNFTHQDKFPLNIRNIPNKREVSPGIDIFMK